MKSKIPVTISMKIYGNHAPPPSTFRAIISWKKNSAPRAFMTFFIQVLHIFGAIFRKIGRTVPKLRNVMSSSVGSKFDNFLDLCTKRMENGFLCQNSILSSKMQYLLSLQLKSLLYLLIFNTQTIPLKKQ